MHCTIKLDTVVHGVALKWNAVKIVCVKSDSAACFIIVSVLVYFLFSLDSNAYLTGTWIGVGDKSFRCRYFPPVVEVNVSGHDQVYIT